MPIDPESVQVWLVRLPEHEIPRWRPLLSAGEWDRAMRFRLPADQRRFAVTRGILRDLLGRYLRVAPAAIEFTANEFGKPSVAGPVTFNVSHSCDRSLLAFSHDLELGVDIEHIGGERVVNDLAQRILSPREYQRFAPLAGRDRRRAFFQIWTLKEAFLKAIGSGFSIAPESIEVAFFPDEPQLLASEDPQIVVNEWTLSSLSLDDEDYAAAIAVKHPNPLIEFQPYNSFP